MERLDKFLCGSGAGTRSQVKDILKAGRVTVDGNPEKDGSRKIDPAVHTVTLDGQPLGGKRRMVVMLNKPAGYVTATEDAAEKTVMELLPEAWRHMDLRPVGRLDKATEGLLLFTNDGDLTKQLTHPSYKKKKIYHVWLDKNVSIEDMEKIANGLELEDGEIHADAISYASEDDKSQVGIEIHSGRNRIVRRIFESLGYHVVKLDRVYFAGLTKKNLGRGKWRYLNEREVNALRMGAFE